MPETQQAQLPAAEATPSQDSDGGGSSSSSPPGRELAADKAHLSEDSDEGCCAMEREANFASLPTREAHEKFIRDAVDLIIAEAVFEGTSRKSRVVEWVEPASLPASVDLAPRQRGESHESLLRLVSAVIRYSVKTGHPRFVNQLYSSVDPYGLVGQWLTDALNPSVYTYEVSPVFSLMEESVLREMRRAVGWPDGEGDGIFCPGGSMANGYAINLARHWMFPEVKEEGVTAVPRLALFTSEDAHYSVKKLAAFLGLGSANVRCVRVDEAGRMRVDELRLAVRRAVDEGARPLMVSATAGTTVLGAFDPLRDIAEVCRRHRMWLHVDAAWGGGALMSRKHRALLDGVELADSVTWNPHKLLAAPQQCSTLLTRHKDLLQSAHGSKATYLFQQDKFYDTSYDLGDKHVQCGRRADVLKFWLMWKAKGSAGLEQHVERVFELSRYFVGLIRHRNGWDLLLEPECTNVCFRYIPPSKRHLQGDELMKAMHTVAPIVKGRMVKKGSMLITYQPIRGQPNFFRLVLQNSGLTEADMHFFVEEIERLSDDL
ncbi:cysteine sulfinic acid decarboxylase isoform X2 [Phymastichus coffea]|uniref:cysteine sulfinic acid decarboxylase isoform X2 n=1 Tax=Phymastichus coffea TaxID=108790 RepID=UPI00273B6EE7|nr:cysteine sulfinic acid decarboxylase isoform X2 [Phymastichus coffea]